MVKDNYVSVYVGFWSTLVTCDRQDIFPLVVVSCVRTTIKPVAVSICVTYHDKAGSCVYLCNVPR